MRICNRHDIAITIAHYPSGTSKWNPVEHRLFSEISKNWAGRPLDSYETILKYIRTTTTSSGCEYAHTLSGVVIRRASKSLTSGCRRFPLQRTRLYPNGTTPSDRLENGNLFCRRPLVGYDCK